MPTRAGIFALLLPIVLGIAAITASNNLLFLVLGGTLGAIVLSGVLSEHNLRRITVDVRPIVAPYAGEPAWLEVTFARTTHRHGDPPAFDLRLRERVRRKDRGGKGSVLDAALAVLDGASGQVLVRKTFHQRGDRVIEGCVLSTRYPFGLLVKSKDLDLCAEILVRPRRVPVPAGLASPGAVVGTGEASLRKGAGFDFYGVREREERDDLRRVHALRSLSLGHDVVVETEAMERPTAWIGIVNARAVDAMALERATEVLQAAVIEWDRLGYAVGVATLSRTISPGAVSLDGILDAIARLDRVGPDDVERSPPAIPSMWIVPAGASSPSGARCAVFIDAEGGSVVRRLDEGGSS